jgi:hypothetical protein
VISVAQYQCSEGASSAFQEAVQGSLEAPGGEGETVSDLGEKAFIGTSAQGEETHVGGGALYGDLIVIVTLQGYDGTNKNKAKVTELIRMQTAAAKRAVAYLKRLLLLGILGLGCLCSGCGARCPS